MKILGTEITFIVQYVRPALYSAQLQKLKIKHRRLFVNCDNDRKRILSMLLWEHVVRLQYFMLRLQLKSWWNRFV